MTRILHIADLHLSERSTIAGQIVQAPSGINLATQDTIDAVVKIVDAARVAGPVDGIVIAGDLFDSPRPSPQELRIAADLLAYLAGCCVARRVLLIPGNHDELRQASEATACTPLGWHEAVRLVESPEVVYYAGIRWACLPYPRRSALREVEGTEDASATETLSAALSTLALGMLAQGAQALVAHCTVGGATVGAQPRSIEGDIELASDVLDAYPATLLGHIHQQQKPRANAAAWYSGSPTVQDFGEEGETKGGIVWVLDPGNGGFAQPIQVTGRPWRTIDFNAPVAFEIGQSGVVYRVRGDLPHEDLLALRANLAKAREAGAFIQDELRLLEADRTRDADIGRAGIDDTEILRRALTARQVSEDDHERLALTHAGVVQGG